MRSSTFCLSRCGFQWRQPLDCTLLSTCFALKLLDCVYTSLQPQFLLTPPLCTSSAWFTILHPAALSLSLSLFLVHSLALTRMRTRATSSDRTHLSMETAWSFPSQLGLVPDSESEETVDRHQNGPATQTLTNWEKTKTLSDTLTHTLCVFPFPRCVFLPSLPPSSLLLSVCNLSHRCTFAMHINVWKPLGTFCQYLWKANVLKKSR